MILPLSSCRGAVPDQIIPVAGGTTLPPTATTESEKIPTTTQENQSLPEATGVSPTNFPETPACQTPTATIKSNNAYLRDGPDLRFITIAPYKNGDEFALVGRYKDWFQVESSDGNMGWLYKDWLSLPSNIDTNNICSILEEDVPTITQDSQRPPRDDEEDCYYDSCN